MEMVDFSVRIPKDMIPYLTTHGQEQDFERNALMLYGLIKSGRMSHGRAAEVLGVRKWDLIEFYNSRGLPYLDQSREELLAELTVFDELKGKRRIAL